VRIDRRTALFALCGVFVGCRATAQVRGKVYRVGCVPGGPLAPRAHQWDAFRKSLRDLGWIEGKNIVLDFRAPAREGDRFDPLIADLVQAKVDALVVTGSQAAFAAKKLTSTIPVVITATGNPVGDGLIQSLGRPGGNITGLSILAVDLSAKRLELLRELLPKLSRVAVLWGRAGEAEMHALRAAAPDVRVSLSEMALEKIEDIGPVSDKLGRTRPSAIYVVNTTYAFGLRAEIAEMAARLRIPAIYGLPSYARSGGLIAYGPSDTENYSRAAVMLDKILKGANPAEIPFEQPTNIELIINRKAAKAAGIEIPRALLLRADHVID
jgi:putative tryptophan/tyrosine transport system substrate-binding protein